MTILYQQYTSTVGIVRSCSVLADEEVEQNDEQVHAYMTQKHNETETSLHQSVEEVARLSNKNKEQACRIEELEQKLDRTKSLSGSQRP